MGSFGEEEEEEPNKEEAKEEDAQRSEVDLAAESFRTRKARRLRAPTGPSEISSKFLRQIVDELLERVPISEEQLCTIYPVPPEFQESHKDVSNFYAPRVVSIGPYHRGRKERRLRRMQDHKWTCLYKLIHRHHSSPDEDLRPLTLLQTCLNKMIAQEEAIRERYWEKIDLDGEELALRMLLDGGFIIYLLLKEAKIIEIEADDVRHVVGRVWIWDLVKYDLLLLENQIPFFVIKILFDILVPDCSDFNLVDYALRYFSSLDPCRKQAQHRFYYPACDVLHLLHLVHLSLLPCSQYYKHYTLNPPSQQWIPSATELKNSRVTFKKRKKENQGSFLSFLDIKFSDGVMEIPQLRLHDYSVSLFRNLVAFEQCFPDTECHITAYAKLMNCLIDKEEDVRSLHLDQILVSNITTEEDAAQFFKRLCNGTHCSPEKNYLGGLINDVNKHHGKKLNQTRAYFVRTYCGNPVVTIALIASIIPVVLSVFSNILSIKRGL